jgi:fumarate hydratase class II
MRRLAERSASITMILVPHVGYDAATRVATTMSRDGLSLTDALRAEGVELEVEIDLLSLARPDN